MIFLQSIVFCYQSHGGRDFFMHSAFKIPFHGFTCNSSTGKCVIKGLIWNTRFYYQRSFDGFYIISHTSPDGWVRAKKMYITFDTNFGPYLPRGTIIDGSLKCRIGAFCTIAKNWGEMPKKGLKTGQNGVKFLFSLHTCWISTFVAIFYFQYFSFGYL